MDLETQLIDAAKMGYAQDIERVLRRVELGAKLDLNTRDAHGNTALHFLATRGLTRGIELLLAAGAEVNLVNNNGFTALDMASAIGHSDAASLLSEHGARFARYVAHREETEDSVDAKDQDKKSFIRCPYCGEAMKEEKGPIKVLVGFCCDGGPRGRHERIIVSSVDNKFRTVSPEIAKELALKGYGGCFDSEAEHFVIAKAREKVGEMSQDGQRNFDRGATFWKSGDRQKAMEIWEDNVKKFPAHRDSWYNLGLAYGRDDQFDRGVQCLKKALGIDPSDGQAWWHLGHIYGLMGDQGESGQAYRQAKELGWQQPPL